MVSVRRGIDDEGMDCLILEIRGFQLIELVNRKHDIVG